MWSQGDIFIVVQQLHLDTDLGGGRKNACNHHSGGTISEGPSFAPTAAALV